MKTIKQIADELGMDKQKVYRFIKRNCISEVHQERGMMYYDDAVKMLVKVYYNGEDTASDEVHQSTSNDIMLDVLKSTIETLQNQLSVKDRQIEELTIIVREQAESINADRKNELAGTLIDGHKNILPEASAPDAGAESGKQRGLFGWLFRDK